MIDKQAIDAMTQMLAVIKKHAKGAYPEVETGASREHRRRAWAITALLARFAAHAAESDLYFLFASDPRETDAERAHCRQIARQEDRGFMKELHNFEERVAEYEAKPIRGGRNRTDDDIVRELESLLQSVKGLKKLQASSALPAGTKLTAKDRKLREAHEAAIKEELASLKPKLERAEKLALSRGIVVSLGRYGTVIKRVPTTSTKVSAAATRTKKTAKVKLVADELSPSPNAEVSLVSKAA